MHDVLLTNPYQDSGMGSMRQIIIPIFGGLQTHDNSPEVVVLEHETDSDGFLPFPDPRGGAPTALRSTASNSFWFSRTVKSKREVFFVRTR